MPKAGKEIKAIHKDEITKKSKDELKKVHTTWYNLFNRDGREGRRALTPEEKLTCQKNFNLAKERLAELYALGVEDEAETAKKKIIKAQKLQVKAYKLQTGVKGHLMKIKGTVKET